MTKLKVFFTRRDIPVVANKLLRRKFEIVSNHLPHTAPEDYLVQHVQGAAALCCFNTDNISERVIKAAGPQLKLVATFSLGIEHIDLDTCKKRNIIVTNLDNPTYCAVVAEFTIALLLAVARRYNEACAGARNGEWKQVWHPYWLVGRGLVDSTVGIVGMGRIGQLVLDMILPFKAAKILYHNNHIPVAKAESLGAQQVTFEDLLRESDFVVALCSLTEASRDIFDAKAFSLMKPNAVFINTSRGGIVDQEALIKALKNKTIKAAGIDVMYPEPLPLDHELLSIPNLVVTPHIAYADKLSIETNYTFLTENIIEVLEDRPPLSPVF